jgi:hypothetical protein
MYTKAQLISAIKKEVHVLEHLQSKINEELHGHRFTAPQRSIRELLAYIAATPWKIVEVINSGDMSVFATMKEYTEHFDPKDFVKTLKDSAAHAIKTIEEATEEHLAETVTLFGSMTGTRAQHLVEVVYGQLMAYKMQLFLQMKHAGLGDLNSMNLNHGKDTPAA